MPRRDFLDILPLYPNEDEETIRARWNEWANEGLDPVADVDRWTDTREGSMFFICTQPGVRESAREYDLMGTEVIAAATPIFAWGSYLDYHAEVRSIVRLGATRADGFVLLYGTPATVIPAGLTITLPPGDPDEELPVYEVQTAGVLSAALAAPTGPAGAGATTGGTLAANTYRYVVTTLDPLGGESTPTAEVAVVTTGATGRVTLSWNALPSAASFRVYRKTGATGPPYDLLASIPAGTYSYADTGAVVPNGAVHPPAVSTTKGAYLAPVEAQVEGSAGNVSAGAVTVVESPIPGLDGAVNTAPIVGGTEEETDEGLAERVLQSFQNLGSANVAQYTSWASAFAGVGRVKVIPEFAGAGTVLLVVTTADGDPVSQDTLDGLQALIDPPVVTTSVTLPVSSGATTVSVGSTTGFLPSSEAGQPPRTFRVGDTVLTYTLKLTTQFQGVSGWPAGLTYVNGTPVTQGGGAGLAPIGHTVVVKTATALLVDVAATLEPEPGYSLDGAGGTTALRTSITDAVRAYVEAVQAGGEVIRSRVIGAILDVVGVHDVALTLTLNTLTQNVQVASDPLPQAPVLDDLTLTEAAV